MKILTTLALSLVLSASVAFAEPVSDATLEELLTLNKSDKLVADMQSQIKTMLDKSIAQSLEGQKLSDAQKKALDNMTTKMIDALKAEISWEKLKPITMKLYKETFTDEEVKGIVAFYKTPAGEALINKTPALMQKTMEATQGMMGNLQPKIKEIQQEFAAEMQAASEPKKEDKEPKK